MQWRKVWKKRWVALHGMEIVYMDKEPTSKNMSDIQITKAQFTGASVVKEEDPDNDPTGFAIHVRLINLRNLCQLYFECYVANAKIEDVL